MSKTISKVKQFMTVAGQEVKDSPAIPSADVMKLRLLLEYEELLEKAKGMGLLDTFVHIAHRQNNKLRDKMWRDKETQHININAVFTPVYTGFVDSDEVNLDEVFDACVDQRVVNDGTVLAFGMQGIFDKGFDLVHENNMSKFITSKQQAEDTIKILGPEAYYDSVKYEGVVYYRIKSTVTGKVLKPLSFKAVVLTPLLDIAIDAAINAKKQSN
jgi:predicted HAD superfamily Cof-like phosphohydrolase